eukprot:797299_1
MAVSSIIVLIVWILWNTVPDIHALEEFFFARALIVYVGVFNTHIISIILPLHQHRSHMHKIARQEKNIREQVEAKSTSQSDSVIVVSTEKRSDVVTVDDILRDTDGLVAFRAFLDNEFATENLCFWEEVNQFKKSLPVLTRSKQMGSAKCLAQKYIQKVTQSPCPSSVVSIS